MKLTHEHVSLRTKHTFTIARGGADEFRVVVVTVTDKDGATGVGEASPSRFYGEYADTVPVALAQFAPILEQADAWSLDAIEHAMNAKMRGNGAAKGAVMAALCDLQGKRLGQPLHRLWGLDPAASPRSSFTIAIAAEPELRLKVREAKDYPILKVKLGSDRDEEIIRIIREEAPEKTLYVDANCAWTPKLALNHIEWLVDYDVEFVEQPLPPEDVEGMRFVRERSPLPIIADESCVVGADIPKLAGVVDGINIKLAKCGGPLEAIRMAAIARAHGMRVMMGCMIETSVGITTAAHLAPLLDYADLDGAALVANDPWKGARIDGGVISVPTGPGLGVTRA
ncbi:MAG TPA: dipeptide epimerase [Gemmatimonadaceae bacterium]|nr:dipeptide epimerase [Gemmatimonadaceae bacterium]